MAWLKSYGPALAFTLLAVAGFAAAVLAAYDFGAAQPAPRPAFLIVKETYDKLLPFLLTTVAVGAAGAAYTVVLRVRQEAEKAAEDLREAARRTRDAELAKRAATVQRLREIYNESLRLMYSVRLARRRLRVMAVRGEAPDTWCLRRAVFDALAEQFSAAALDGRRQAKMFKFDGDALHDAGDNKDRLAALESQFSAIFGILDGVMEDLDFVASTQKADTPEALVPLPPRLVAYANNATGGNSSFRKGAEQFDAFVEFVLGRLREMEQPIAPSV